MLVSPVLWSICPEVDYCLCQSGTDEIECFDNQETAIKLCGKYYGVEATITATTILPTATVWVRNTKKFIKIKNIAFIICIIFFLI